MVKKVLGRRVAALTAAGLLLAAGATAGASAEEASPVALSHTMLTVGGDYTPAWVPFTGENTTTISLMSDWGVEVRCDLSEIGGWMLQGATVDPAGPPIGVITSVSFDLCVATALQFPVTVTGSIGLIEVINHPASAGDPVEVRLNQISLQIVETGSSTGPCEFWATGSADAILHPGPYVDGGNTYDGGLEMVPADFAGPSGFDMNIAVPNSPTCGGLVEVGDRLGFWYDNESTGVTSRYGLDTDGAGAISHG